MSEPSAPARPLPKKILIVRLGAMGDVIHALPAVVSLRMAFPEAEIGWVIERRWENLVSFPKLVNHVHEVDTRRWRKNLWKSRAEVGSALGELRAKRYDIAIDFQGAIKSAMIALASGASKRIGSADPWEKPASLFYTERVVTRLKNVVGLNEELVMALTHSKGWPGVDAIAEHIRIDRGIEDWAADKLHELKLTSHYVILNPGAGWGAKQWPVERYAELARALGADGISSLVNYGPGEEELALAVEQHSDGHAVAATFSISQLMAITQKASLFIGGDTGPMHLAALLRVPVVAIFGPTDPARNGPIATWSIVLRDPASVTSHKRVRETEAGLRNITTAQVLQAARELLSMKQTEVRS